MIDRIFTATLAFCLLIGATLAICAAWFEPRSIAQQQIVRLPAVEVVAKRPVAPNAQVVQLPAVHVVVKRAAPQLAPGSTLPAVVAATASDTSVPRVQ